ncbi:hypothetical protein PsorP6_016011 [Peronosclerospora sorghi]|uniref:Uncharacterized protein n=1 Tax=Peronosclerospora sorghi TaxID=230839 RepID=A0ACC0WPK2_9STRA|nr:hypothetical protein PsorP6_016011 [Peronosclerospora sorghi]
MENFFTDNRAELAKDRMQIPLFAHPSPRSDILQNVTKAISNFALKKISEQLELARQPVKDDDKPCSNSFTTVWGLSCYHRLRHLVEAKKRIEIGDVHCHWHTAKFAPLILAAIINSQDDLPVVLESAASNLYSLPDHQQRAAIEQLHVLSQQLPEPIREPEVDRTKGRPSKSTRRYPSGFEYAEGTVKKKRPETCGARGHPGHRKNSAKCPNRLANAGSQGVHEEGVNLMATGSSVANVVGLAAPMAPMAFHSGPALAERRNNGE